jgi:hypothetical protein
VAHTDPLTPIQVRADPFLNLSFFHVRLRRRPPGITATRLTNPGRGSGRKVWGAGTYL